MSDDPNWVKARAACTLEENFASLSKSIRKDVRRFNGLPNTIRADRLFVVQDRKAGIAVVRAKLIHDHRAAQGERVIADEDFDQDFVAVEYGNDLIVARRRPQFELTIHPRWNADTLTCDLFIDDTPHPLWNISARILEPFLFDDKTA
ncbi:MAG: hypothetical protein OXH60_13960 [Rhodospirillales bacterium]|nr:hypothetical protein [Rhodospirillales bacterium]